jgi:hypothetical protein
MHAIIQPVPAFPQPAVGLLIANVTVFPGSRAGWVWQLVDAAKATVGTGQIAIEGDAYAAWGTDDDYLYTYTATALGLTIIEIVPDAPPAPPAMVEPPPPVITEPPLHDGAPHAPVVDDTAVPVAPSVADSEEPK